MANKLMRQSSLCFHFLNQATVHSKWLPWWGLDSSWFTT